VVLVVDAPDGGKAHLEVDPQGDLGSTRWVSDSFDLRWRSCLAVVCCCSSPVPGVAGKKVALPLDSEAGSLQAS